MLKVIAVLSRWGFRLTLSFLVVLALLSLTPEFLGWVQPAREKAANLERVSRELAMQQADFDRDSRSTIQSANSKIQKLRRAGSSQINQLENEIKQTRDDALRAKLDKVGMAKAAFTGNSDKIVASIRAEYIQVPIADQTLRIIALRRKSLSLAGQIERHNERNLEYRANVKLRDKFSNEAESELRNPICQRVAIPGACEKVVVLRKWNVALDEWQQDLLEDQKTLERRMKRSREYEQAKWVVVDEAKVASLAVAKFEDQVQQVTADSKANSITFTKSSLEKYGWFALWIVVAGALLPIAYKLFTFLVIAPWASRARSVQIMPYSGGMEASASQMSVDVPLDIDTELLVRSGVQSVSSDIEGSDVIVLKKRMAFTCIAAGLVNMQRLRAARPDYVAVTAPDEEHAEVALIKIPGGGAVVLQPRALVGVLKRRSDTLRIDRPWRFNFLISWVTFQFRYVVFHGPCTLIVQGQRGVRVEDAQNGRMINKRLTLGFDAGLSYGAARSPSFLPYLLGSESLFNDRFSGSGNYLFEQRPSGSGKGSLWGRGLKGLGDAALNAFGI